MSPAPRHTEELAVETLYGTGEDDPGLLNRLLTLTSGEPTTEELEEARTLITRQILPTMNAWISSRHIINARKTMTGEKAAELARAINHRDRIPVETPEEAVELDRIERAHPTPGGGLHPIFENLTNPYRKHA